MKIGVLTTHPIQYQVPWFRLLAEHSEIDLTVYFCMIPNQRQQGEGFGVDFEWDIPLLEGYRHVVLHNVAEEPTVSRFGGCDTPGIDEIVREGGFNAFIVNGWVVKSCLQLLRACRKYRVPCIVRGESNDLRPRAGWKRMIHRVLLRRYTAFLYIGEGNRRFYLNNGVLEDKLFFAPYCVENERFRRAALELRGHRAEIRATWEIPRDTVTFVFCGKLIEKKRPMDVLRALSELSSNPDGLPPIHVVVAGAGELLGACRSYARDRHLPVTFTEFLNQSEIARAYVAADCLVLPSDDGETWGLVVNEGMACGLPAIVSDAVGCQRDLVEDGETGAVYPVGDVEALAACMRTAASNRRGLRDMGRGAEARVARYSYAEVLRGTLAALDSVAQPSAQ